MWERVRPDSAPTVSRVRGELDEHGDLRITWSATCGTDAEEAWIRWSTDGTDWRALTVVCQGCHATIPAEQLPSGTIHVQVLVHDGFSTVDAASEAIELPARPPAVTILYRRRSRRPGCRHLSRQPRPRSPHGVAVVSTQYGTGRAESTIEVPGPETAG